MVVCENLAAFTHALPNNQMPVRDRLMTLTIQCRDEAEYTNSMLGIGAGKNRRGGVVRTFHLCDNHSHLFQQIDYELVQDAWSPSHTAQPVHLV